jgi:threonine dehydrogenase-like Zn-dependent dehydrogenase
LTEGIGSSIVIDTTGNADLIKNGLDFTANRGQMVVLGIPPRDGIIEIHLLKYLEVSEQSKN